MQHQLMPQLYKHLTTCKSRQFFVLIFIFHCHSIHTVLEGTFSRWQVSNNKQLNKGLQWLKSQSLSNRSPAFEPGQQMLCICQIYAVCAFLLRCGNLKFHHVKDCIYFTHSTNLCNLTASRDINFTKIQMIKFFFGWGPAFHSNNTESKKWQQETPECIWLGLQELLFFFLINAL